MDDEELVFVETHTELVPYQNVTNLNETNVHIFSMKDEEFFIQIINEKYEIDIVIPKTIKDITNLEKFMRNIIHKIDAKFEVTKKDTLYCNHTYSLVYFSETNLIKYKLIHKLYQHTSQISFSIDLSEDLFNSLIKMLSHLQKNFTEF